MFYIYVVQKFIKKIILIQFYLMGLKKKSQLLRMLNGIEVKRYY